MQNKTAILVLAAGGSSRMGEPKQLLTWSRTTLLGSTIERALELNNSEVFVVLGAFSEKIKQSIEKYSVSIVINKNWNLGMGASISSGVEEVLKRNCFENILITLADQPFVNSEYLFHLINIHGYNSNKIIASDYIGRAGVPAIFGKKYFSELKELECEYGAKELLKKYFDFVEFPILDFFSEDIDTQENYNELIHRVKKKGC
jgi:molybdenum cofactor cytidylyltransferase